MEAHFKAHFSGGIDISYLLRKQVCVLQISLANINICVCMCVNVHISRSSYGRQQKCVHQTCHFEQEANVCFIFIFFLRNYIFNILFFYALSYFYHFHLLTVSLSVCGFFFPNASATTSAIIVVVVSIFCSIFVSPNFKMSKCVCFFPSLPPSRPLSIIHEASS